MARITIATDNFDDNSLSTDWTDLWTNPIVNASGRFYGTYSSSAGSTPELSATARWTGTGTFTDDQFSAISLPYLADWGAAVPYFVGVLVRASADTGDARDYYAAAVQFDGSGGYVTVLFKVVNGTATTLHSARVAWSANDVLVLEVQGTLLRVCKGTTVSNATALGGSFTQTDSSLSSGNPGILAAGASGFYADNWVGGFASIRNLKVLIHPSAASATNVAGVVCAAPSASDITGTKVGEFTAQTFESVLDGSGAAVLKVPVTSFGGGALTVGATPAVLMRNATNTSGFVPGLIIEE